VSNKVFFHAMFLSPFCLGGNLGLGEVCITVVVVDVIVVVVIGVVGVVSDMRKRVLNVNVIKFISSYIYACVHQFTCYPVYIMKNTLLDTYVMLITFNM
jgi:hypothetical protein